MEEVIVPIGICVILPVAVVLIVALTRINGDNKRAQIILKAIESNKDVDTDKLIESLKKQRISDTQLLNRRLLCGCIFTFIGLFLVITGIFNSVSGHTFNSDSVTVPLMFGGISLAIGISFLIVFFVTRKATLNKESNPQ